MAVERVPGEKMYIDWVGDQPKLLLIPETGDVKAVHIFATTLGVSSLIYAEAFLDEKLSSFVEGTIHAIQFYGGITKYLVPDNLKTAINKHTKDELVCVTESILRPRRFLRYDRSSTATQEAQRETYC